MVAREEWHVCSEVVGATPFLMAGQRLERAMPVRPSGSGTLTSMALLGSQGQEEHIQEVGVVKGLGQDGTQNTSERAGVQERIVDEVQAEPNQNAEVPEAEGSRDMQP